MSTTIINSTSRSTISDSIEYKHSYTELYVKNICSLTLKTCVKNPLWCYQQQNENSMKSSAEFWVIPSFLWMRFIVGPLKQYYGLPNSDW